jgi:hypothetical protein
MPIVPQQPHQGVAAAPIVREPVMAPPANGIIYTGHHIILHSQYWYSAWLGGRLPSQLAAHMAQEMLIVAFAVA